MCLGRGMKKCFDFLGASDIQLSGHQRNAAVWDTGHWLPDHDSNRGRSGGFADVPLLVSTNDVKAILAAARGARH